MYRISKDGEVLAYKEELNYIRKHENGCYVMTDRKNAEGIAVNGTAYNMYDTATHLEDCEYVVAQKIDVGDELQKLQALDIIMGVIK